MKIQAPQNAWMGQGSYDAFDARAAYPLTPALVRILTLFSNEAGLCEPRQSQYDVRPHPGPLPRGFALPTSFYEV